MGEEHRNTPPVGWRDTSLGQITTFAGGYAFPRKYQGIQNSEIPFVKVSDMNSPGNEKVISFAINTIDRTTLKEIRAKSWPADTVVFPKVGAALLTEKRRILGVESAFDNNCMGLIPGNQIDPMFLLYFMETISLGRIAQRGVVPSVNQSHVRSIRILLPPLTEQHRITDLIGSVDKYVNGLRVRADAARTARLAMLHDLLAPGGDVSGWRDTTLGEIARVVSGGTPKTTVPGYWGGDIVWVIPSEIVAQEGGVVRQSARMITQAGLAGSSAKMLPKGAVLVTSRATIGAVALAGVPLCTNQGFASLVPGKDTISHFLMYWCQANTHEFILRSGGNTFKEVSRKKVARIPISLPPLPEQRRIVDLIEPMDTHTRALGACVDLARNLRAGLLFDLLSGRHEIPPSYDRFLSDL